MVVNNLPTVISACQEFEVNPALFSQKVLDEEWEYLDVTARCHVLYGALYDILNEMMDIWKNGGSVWVAWF